MILKLSLILFILMILIGGERGLKSFVTLIINFIIWICSIYSLALGADPFYVLVISSLLYCLFTVGYQNGFHLKTLAVYLSVAGVILFSSFLISYFSFHFHITGFNEFELQQEDIEYLSAVVNLPMLKILIMTIVWGQLGAIIDTSMAISSALNEIHYYNPNFSILRLFREGMLIGKDILGTTINTLAFVFFGEFILLFIYYIVYAYPVLKILNSTSFLQAICPVLLSCIGCITIIPLTAIVFSLIAKNKKIQAFFSKREHQSQASQKNHDL